MPRTKRPTVQKSTIQAITDKTTAKLIKSRSTPNVAKIDLTHLEDSIVSKGNIGIAKNCLKAKEVEELNRIVVIYLETKPKTKQPHQYDQVGRQA
ncbi:MAG: virulence RhuM family protein [Rhodobacteraceae bacterium]|nr:virulence RhuM family protein [Paracoccaceae bacterium]